MTVKWRPGQRDTQWRYCDNVIVMTRCSDRNQLFMYWLGIYNRIGVGVTSADGKYSPEASDTTTLAGEGRRNDCDSVQWADLKTFAGSDGDARNALMTIIGWRWPPWRYWLTLLLKSARRSPRRDGNDATTGRPLTVCWRDVSAPDPAAIWRGGEIIVDGGDSTVWYSDICDPSVVDVLSGDYCYCCCYLFVVVVISIHYDVVMVLLFVLLLLFVVDEPWLMTFHIDPTLHFVVGIVQYLLMMTWLLYWPHWLPHYSVDLIVDYLVVFMRCTFPLYYDTLIDLLVLLTDVVGRIWWWRHWWPSLLLLFSIVVRWCVTGILDTLIFDRYSLVILTLCWLTPDIYIANPSDVTFIDSDRWYLLILTNLLTFDDDVLFYIQYWYLLVTVHC